MKVINCNLVSQMEVAFDYGKDELILNGVVIPLDRLRDFLLLWYPQLVANHRIKAIKKQGRTVFTYDWQTVFYIAQEGRFILAEFFDDYRGHPNISLN